MLRLFHDLFPALESRLEEDTYEVEMRFGPAPAGVASPKPAVVLEAAIR
jgi:hypothetical protein